MTVNGCQNLLKKKLWYGKTKLKLDSGNHQTNKKNDYSGLFTLEILVLFCYSCQCISRTLVHVIPTFWWICGQMVAAQIKTYNSARLSPTLQIWIRQIGKREVNWILIKIFLQWETCSSWRIIINCLHQDHQHQKQPNKRKSMEKQRI